MRGWAFYDLECRGCGKKGLLGVWSVSQRGDTVWSGEWNGFFGIVDRTKGLLPETVLCAGCCGIDVNIIAREEEAAIRA